VIADNLVVGTLESLSLVGFRSFCQDLLAHIECPLFAVSMGGHLE
jgi:hypothetical protein